MIGPFGSIPGIICGRIALREYKAGGVIEGQSMARAGIVIGWVGLGLFVASMVVGLIVLLFIGRSFDAIQHLR